MSILLVLGMAGAFTLISFYTNHAFYESKLAYVSSKISFAWGWLVFSTNTILTMSIVVRIL